jgi:hypothetical protein
MVELRMWKWEYTDDSGQRRVSRWLMTEHEALRYKDAVRVERTLQVVFLPPTQGVGEREVRFACTLRPPQLERRPQ